MEELPRQTQDHHFSRFEALSAARRSAGPTLFQSLVKQEGDMPLCMILVSQYCPNDSRPFYGYSRLSA